MFDKKKKLVIKLQNIQASSAQRYLFVVLFSKKLCYLFYTVQVKALNLTV